VADVQLLSNHQPHAKAHHHAAPSPTVADVQLLYSYQPAAIQSAPAPDPFAGSRAEAAQDAFPVAAGAPAGEINVSAIEFGSEEDDVSLEDLNRRSDIVVERSRG
jgi:hypothetical protein